MYISVRLFLLVVDMSISFLAHVVVRRIWFAMIDDPEDIPNTHELVL